MEYSNATPNGHDTKTSPHRIFVITAILRRHQFTATFLPIETSLFPENANKNACLLQQGDGVEVSGEAGRTDEFCSESSSRLSSVPSNSNPSPLGCCVLHTLHLVPPTST